VLDLKPYQALLAAVDRELSLLGEALLHSGISLSPCRQGCFDCCRPLSLLPIEAYAIACSLSASLPPPCAHQDPVELCPFLQEDFLCLIYEARPVLCRTRGFPVSYLNGDGEWETEVCPRRGNAGRFIETAAGSPGELGIRLEAWNAWLFQLNEKFCLEGGLAPDRISMTELRSMGPRTRELLDRASRCSPSGGPGELPVYSREDPHA
jgi:Fe-S-cluster containining protein